MFENRFENHGGDTFQCDEPVTFLDQIFSDEWKAHFDFFVMKRILDIFFVLNRDHRTNTQKPLYTRNFEIMIHRHRIFHENPQNFGKDRSRLVQFGKYWWKMIFLTCRTQNIHVLCTATCKLTYYARILFFTFVRMCLNERYNSALTISHIYRLKLFYCEHFQKFSVDFRARLEEADQTWRIFSQTWDEIGDTWSEREIWDFARPWPSDKFNTRFLISYSMTRLNTRCLISHSTTRFHIRRQRDFIFDDDKIWHLERRSARWRLTKDRWMADKNRFCFRGKVILCVDFPCKTPCKLLAKNYFLDHFDFLFFWNVTSWCCT